MARHRSFSFEFKRQLVSDILEGRVGMRETARQHSLSRNLIRLWIEKYEAGQLTDEVADSLTRNDAGRRFTSGKLARVRPPSSRIRRPQ